MKGGRTGSSIVSPSSLAIILVVVIVLIVYPLHESLTKGVHGIVDASAVTFDGICLAGPIGCTELSHIIVGDSSATADGWAVVLALVKRGGGP